MSHAHKNNWRPSASLSHLKARAQLMTQLRTFFALRDVMEVSTPVLASAGVTDPFIDNFTTQFDCGPEGVGQALYLQTSPEYAMKRLLASGCEHIYQIGPAFRHEGMGRQHNPEFTMLEWYRTGFSMQDLVDEVVALIATTLNVPSVKQVTYQEVFTVHLSIDPLGCDLTSLSSCAFNHDVQLHGGTDGLDKDDFLQLLFSNVIEPKFANDEPVVVTHFPASQASLATINSADNRTANRFELYFKGIELANGFHELTDAKQQALRFENDNQKRAKLNKPQAPIDHHFLCALEAGLADCAGVALGVDRLLMLKLGAKHIDEVMAFTTANA